MWRGGLQLGLLYCRGTAEAWSLSSPEPLGKDQTLASQTTPPGLAQALWKYSVELRGRVQGQKAAVLSLGCLPRLLTSTL